MALQTKELLEKTAAFVTPILQNELPEHVLYHDLELTCRMVDAVEEIGTISGLNEDSIQLLQSVTWLQSLGDKPDEIKAFFEESEIEFTLVSKIQDNLEFLHSKELPRTKEEQVLRDSALMHFATPEFIQRMPLLFKEQQLSGEWRATQEEWYEQMEKQLLKILFCTEAAERAWRSGLERNRKTVAKKRKKLQKDLDGALQKELSVSEVELKELKKKLRKVDKRPERGVETMFRLASKNHFTLNEMVDKKSSILISINSIILSIVIGTVMRELSSDPHLLVPVIMLSVTNLWSIALAVFATRPEKTHGKFNPNENGTESTNLLFYGNFHRMSEGEYLNGIEGLMNDGDKLYTSMAKDVYYLGKTLERKFALLRKSFNIFIVGFITSVFTFILCHVFFGDQSILPLN